MAGKWVCLALNAFKQELILGNVRQWKLTSSLPSHTVIILNHCSSILISPQCRKPPFVVWLFLSFRPRHLRCTSRNRGCVKQCLTSRGVLDVLSVRWTSASWAGMYFVFGSLDDSCLQGCKAAEWLKPDCLHSNCETRHVLKWRQSDASHLQRVSSSPRQKTLITGNSAWNAWTVGKLLCSVFYFQNCFLLKDAKHWVMLLFKPEIYQ